jgi:hemolysin activation/secretion protein
VWGAYPFHEAAFLGGGSTLRGYRHQRFAGDAAVYGTAELRQRLFTTRAPVPVRWGVFGIVDAGRVFLEGESSRKWHTGVGGGLFWSFVKPEYTLSLALVRGNEGRNRIYLQSGFGF